MNVTEAVWLPAPAWKHTMQRVKHAAEEHGLVLSVHDSSILCFLLSGEAAPVGAETGMYTQVN